MYDRPVASQLNTMLVGVCKMVRVDQLPSLRESFLYKGFPQQTCMPGVVHLASSSHVPNV